MAKSCRWDLLSKVMDTVQMVEVRCSFGVCRQFRSTRCGQLLEKSGKSGDMLEFIMRHLRWMHINVKTHLKSRFGNSKLRDAIYPTMGMPIY